MNVLTRTGLDCCSMGEVIDDKEEYDIVPFGGTAEEILVAVIGKAFRYADGYIMFRKTRH